MKTIIWITAIASLVLSSCASQRVATPVVNDEVYAPSATSSFSESVKSMPPDQGTQVIASPDKSVSAAPKSSTFADDYNDYSYSDRIKKFSSTDTTKGYFDESYSSAAPVEGGGGSSGPDINLYFGVGAGFGGYYGSSFSFGWGYPYYGWGYPYYGWGYPYYGYGWYYPWGYPYYSPWYNPWYNPCYCCSGWYGEGYYPPYYANTYYGPRTTLGRTTPSATGTTAQTLETRQAPSAGPNSRSAVPSGGSLNDRSATAPAAQQGNSARSSYRYSRPAATQSATGFQRSESNSQPRVQAERRQPSPKYVRPENAEAAKRSGSAQNYSSPVYRQPKTSQEYLSPRTQGQGNARISNENSGRFATPSSGENRRTVSPGSGGSEQRQVRSSGNAQPSRVTPYQSPGRNSSGSGSYSQPRRTESSGSSSPAIRSGSGSSGSPSGGGSYSAPSRSGGGGGGAPASGGGGGGGRRR